MSNFIYGVFVLAVVCLISTPLSFAGPATIYNCEQFIHNWRTPEWSTQREDHIISEMYVDKSFSRDGGVSLKLVVDFPGQEWRAGIVETEGEFDLTIYKSFSCEVYLPKNAPSGIEARLIFVTGENYIWFEMEKPISLDPGRKTKLFASLRRGVRCWSDGDKTMRLTDELKSEIRKLAIRIESNKARYQGPVYIDNIRLKK